MLKQVAIRNDDRNFVNQKVKYNDIINNNNDKYEVLNLEKIEDMNYFIGKNYPTFFNNFELIDYIDRGSSGIIYKGKTKNGENKRIFSFKFVIADKNKPKIKSKYNEIIYHKKLHHKYISQILAFYKLNDIDYFSVSEFGKYGNLDNFLRKFLKKNILSETFINYLAKQILEALNYMHKKKLYHMDIKKGNIVIDQELNAKLIDFSSTVYLENSEPDDLYTYPMLGTGKYMSLEMMNKTQIQVKYTGKMDVFSLGVTLYNLAFGIYPYGLSKINGNDYDKIREQLNKATLEFPKEVEISKPFKEFLRKVLEKDYLKRYDTREALNDKWIKGWDIINEEKENTGIQENFIIKLISDNIPKFNEYIK